MRIILLAVAVLLVSCNSKSEDKTEKPKEEFKMYEISEMAALMEQMYVENARLKENIINKDSLGQFPEYFNKIDKATFTKGKGRDEFFDENAKTFLKLQAEIYTAKDSKKAFNEMVDQCITCHEVKCGGPIMRIKKLYIK